MPLIDKKHNIAKTGNVFMAGMPGTTLDPETHTLIREYNLAGIILFSRNIESPIQLASLCNNLQECSQKYHGTQLFLAIDQEGGRVARLKHPFTSFPGNSAIGDDPNSSEKAVQFARTTAQEMALVGLNMDFAPVLDVLVGEPEKHLVGRSFGNNPEEVARLGNIIVSVLQENGIMATGKHYPGLGPANLDPHHLLPTIDADELEIQDIHLLPFIAAIRANVAAIMSSHALYSKLDPNVPATLSHKIMSVLLRESLGFKGMLVTDDLEMGAIKNGLGTPEGAIASFEAGADILLICEDQEAVKESIHLLHHKIIEKNMFYQRFEQSFSRISHARSVFLKDYQEVSLEKVRSFFFTQPNPW